VKVIAYGVTLREKIPLGLPERIQALSKLAEAVKVKLTGSWVKDWRAKKFARYQVMEYYGEILRSLTNITKPKFKHLKYLKDIYEGHGMLGKPGKGKKTKNSTNNIKRFLAVKLGLTPDEIGDRVMLDEVKNLVSEVMNDKIHNNFDRIRAQHDASKFIKSLKKDSSKFKIRKDMSKEIRAELDKKVVPIITGHEIRKHMNRANQAPGTRRPPNART